MHILVIGGTIFLGRHVAEAALARGHTLTLFHRGRHNPGLFPQVETIHGDRERDLGLLAGRRWDAVLDTCGYVPRIVRTSAEALANVTSHYTFISTLSVYSDTSIIGINEDHPVGTLADPTVEEITGETYGPLKALCEQAAETALPGRVLTIRPGLIVGPHDPSDRFTYWPWRVSQGGEVLAPERPEYRVQFIDVRDLAAWTLNMIEAGATGVYNATGPEQPLGMGDLLEACRTTNDTRFTWAGAEFLEQQGVAPWSELPLWVPDAPDTAGFSAFDCSKAIAAGLRFRPLHETVRDTLNWAATRPADYQWRAGLSREREAAVLAAKTKH